jgi:hypothetical protein
LPDFWPRIYRFSFQEYNFAVGCNIAHGAPNEPE